MATPPAATPLAPAERRRAFLLGAAIGADLAAATADCHDPATIRERLGPQGVPRPVPAPPGRRRASLALADALLDELLAGGVDLHRLAHRWVDWYRTDGLEVDPPLAASLDHLRDYDAPVPSLPAAGLVPIAAVLPAALASASPASMVSGAYHVARLLDPAEEAALSAVAMVVIGAAFLEGRRDFVPDLMALFRSNSAPAQWVATIGDLLRYPARVPSAPQAGSRPLEAVHWLAWQLQYQPRAAEAMTAMVRNGGIPVPVGTALGALLGARSGLHEWPGEWLDAASPDQARRERLAARLSGEPSPDPAH